MTFATATDGDKQLPFQSKPTWEMYLSDEKVIPGLEWLLRTQWEIGLDHDTVPIKMEVDVVLDREYLNGGHDPMAVFCRIKRELEEFCHHAAAAGEGWSLERAGAYDPTDW